jgi:pyruvate dehydrogenase E2 component (dihydrolipoamide acetyltransferase)
VHQGPFKEGEVVPVLTVIATIGKADEEFSAEPRNAKLAEETNTAKEETPIDVPASVTSVAEHEGKVFASPRARKLADAKNVDLAQVTPTGYDGERVVERDVLAYLSQLPKATPVAQKIAAEVGMDLRAVTATGPGGKITKEDVERAKVTAAKPVVAPPLALPQAEVVERVPLKGVRAIIADRMATSAHTTARVTLFMEADATEFANMRERLRARVEKEWGFAPGYNDLLAKIVVTALRQFPYMNARLTVDAIVRLAHINLGMAVETERGLS